MHLRKNFKKWLCYLLILIIISGSVKIFRGGITKMKKVVKFGGSSLASAKQFEKVGEIIRADQDRKYVVPSAPGKRFDGDIKVTDMLYGCYAAAADGVSFEEKLDGIKARYNEIITGLDLDFSLDDEFVEKYFCRLSMHIR